MALLTACTGTAATGSATAGPGAKAGPGPAGADVAHHGRRAKAAAPVDRSPRDVGKQARAMLPAPTGPYAVGTTSLQLTDHSRQDPWQPESGARELMVSFWYPAVRGASHAARVSYMEPLAGAHFGSKRGAASFNYKLPAGRTDWSATGTQARQNAPVVRGGGRLPVVLYSPGVGDPRTWNTGLVEDLASRGYVVVTVDHTYEASEVQFPGNRLAESVLPGLMKPGVDIGAVQRKTMTARVADTRFVLDALPGLRHRAGLPTGLAGMMDLGRIGMVGHSAGGFTAAQTMHDDPRIKAGANLDGTMDFGGPDGRGHRLSSVARDGVDRPFLLMGTAAADSGDYHHQPSWDAFWTNSRGWHADVTLKNSEHGSYTDAAALLPQLARQGAAPEAAVRADIGTVRPQRAVAATRAYVASFFDRWLRGHDDHLLDGPSPRFPEMTYAQ
ncbi:hypothetical protein [Streptomyces sp. MspMP-M5]|uniref:alpha/beta hydrolase family protein n=1 Tax=unclassified Streptomyces TaxID=2593676 RepID=UPI0003675181|nr:hypothetical protein [Streptomyces sp. MspMP-M5]